MEGGRPTKFTPETARSIVKAVRAGNYIETAAALGGISKDTFYNWVRRGARERQRLEANPRARGLKEEIPFMEFSDAIEKAQAEAEAHDWELIGRHAVEDWKAAAWRLERKFPNKYGRKDRLAAELEHTGNVGLQIVVDYGDGGNDGDSE